jgi:hypothetical protein
MKYLSKSTKLVVKLNSLGSIDYEDDETFDTKDDLITPTFKNIDLDVMFRTLEINKKEKRDKEKEVFKRNSFEFEVIKMSI